MLDLINEERTSRGLDPVQLELRLNDASEDHSSWMLQQDVFSHTGENGSSAGDRMEDAGFEFSGDWTWSENIAWQSERGAPGLADDVEDLHDGLMNSAGHRANILDPDVTVVGIGIETGDYQGYDAVMVTQNFARTQAEVQLDQDTTTPTTPIDPPEMVEVEVPETPTTEPEQPVTEQPETEQPVVAQPEDVAPADVEMPEQPTNPPSTIADILLECWSGEEIVFEWPPMDLDAQIDGTMTQPLDFVRLDLESDRPAADDQETWCFNPDDIGAFISQPVWDYDTFCF
ncbi:Cysteine-rich secretory protein family protein [Falsiruegeria litorea R37]|uniref:Cysteine-rich secretory protein family protein n=1 Tax=Falsiruegeria litorea R37 TaxID=1200284 RepID=A0A1Y5RM97_9RHOB|nr:CAP domain-containing protein [Falsiruegeria litorea]SLN20771.1 Cysteine-rich secretory protein family protein [Falsiruegeria litorea R37]